MREGTLAVTHQLIWAGRRPEMSRGSSAGEEDTHCTITGKSLQTAWVRPKRTDSEQLCSHILQLAAKLPPLLYQTINFSWFYFNPCDLLEGSAFKLAWIFHVSENKVSLAERQLIFLIQNCFPSRISSLFCLSCWDSGLLLYWIWLQSCFLLKLFHQLSGEYWKCLVKLHFWVKKIKK